MSQKFFPPHLPPGVPDPIPDLVDWIVETPVDWKASKWLREKSAELTIGKKRKDDNDN